MKKTRELVIKTKNLRVSGEFNSFEDLIEEVQNVFLNIELSNNFQEINMSVITGNNNLQIGGINNSQINVSNTTNISYNKRIKRIMNELKPLLDSDPDTQTIIAEIRKVASDEEFFIYIKNIRDKYISYL